MGSKLIRVSGYCRRTPHYDKEDIDDDIDLDDNVAEEKSPPLEINWWK